MAVGACNLLLHEIFSSTFLIVFLDNDASNLSVAFGTMLVSKAKRILHSSSCVSGL